MKNRAGKPRCYDKETNNVEIKHTGRHHRIPRRTGI